MSRFHWTTLRLFVLLSVAFVVSIVHYVDNTVNYDDYPRVGPGSWLWNPPQWTVAAAWFVFTAAGVYGLFAYLRSRRTAAAVGLAVYSGSGLIGIFHFAAPGALDMPAWRLSHVVADIVCGLLIFGFALGLAARRLPLPDSA